MTIKDKLKAKVATWPYTLLSLMAAVSAFGAYTCMYSFRKAFAAGTFEGHQYLHVDYKVWLVIAQIIGYTLSKFYGIRFIAEITAGNRAKSILLFIGIAWLGFIRFRYHSGAMEYRLFVYKWFASGHDLGLDIWLPGGPQIY